MTSQHHRVNCMTRDCYGTDVPTLLYERNEYRHRCHKVESQATEYHQRYRATQHELRHQYVKVSSLQKQLLSAERELMHAKDELRSEREKMFFEEGKHGKKEKGKKRVFRVLV